MESMRQELTVIELEGRRGIHGSGRKENNVLAVESDSLRGSTENAGSIGLYRVTDYLQRGPVSTCAKVISRCTTASKLAACSAPALQEWRSYRTTERRSASLGTGPEKEAPIKRPSRTMYIKLQQATWSSVVIQRKRECQRERMRRRTHANSPYRKNISTGSFLPFPLRTVFGSVREGVANDRKDGVNDGTLGMPKEERVDEGQWERRAVWGPIWTQKGTRGRASPIRTHSKEEGEAGEDGEAEEKNERGESTNEREGERRPRAPAPGRGAGRGGLRDAKMLSSSCNRTQRSWSWIHSKEEGEAREDGEAEEKNERGESTNEREGEREQDPCGDWGRSPQKRTQRARKRAHQAARAAPPQGRKGRKRTGIDVAIVAAAGVRGDRGVQWRRVRTLAFPPGLEEAVHRESLALPVPYRGSMRLSPAVDALDGKECSRSGERVKYLPPAQLPCVGVIADEFAEKTSEVEEEEMQVNAPADDAQGITFSWGDI
ncbi:hypothetical protein C8R44DRAFT_862614 [Mycena epipterygia]|nr:hypothetical protein C8R44DRAFT_862614 [Mycena epipterygia]